MRDPDLPMEGTNVVTLRIFPNADRDDTVDLLATSVVDAVGARSPVSGSGDRSRRRQSDAVRRRRPGTTSRALTALGLRSWLSDPPGGGWPAVCDVRLSSRPSTWVLDRSAVGGLGFEGDVLLGWRGGDAVAAELA